MAGPHRPKKSTLKKIYHDFGGQKYDFFDFLQNGVILRGMVNIGFLGAFRAPKGQFPAKYHISGHYIRKYGLLKNRNFRDFLRFFRFWPM